MFVLVRGWVDTVVDFAFIRIGVRWYVDGDVIVIFDKVGWIGVFVDVVDVGFAV